MKHRIVEERDASGEVWNYEIQAKVLFMWLPAGNARTLEYARETVMRLETTEKRVVPNIEVKGLSEGQSQRPEGAT